MANLICKRFASGPKCSDPRKETTEAEKDDCFTNAKIALYTEIYSCLGGKIRDTTCEKSNDNESGTTTCVNELPCLGHEARELIKNCFCTSLTGLTCIVCPDQVDPPVETPVDESTSTYVFKDVSLTLSSLDIPIPIVFGKVIVGGNIIWVGNARDETRVTSTTSGVQTTVEAHRYGFVDIAIGLCAGEIEAIGRIWIADTLVEDNRIEFVDNDNTTFNRTYYDLGLNTELRTGSEAQKMFTNMATAETFGRVPAHRGMAVLMLKSFPIIASSTQMPTVRIEVISRIDRDVASFELSPDVTLDDTSLSVDPVSGRVLVGDGGDLRVIDIRTLEEISTITATDIDVGTSFLTPNADYLFMTGADARYVFGYHHGNYLDAAGVPDLTTGGDWANAVVHDVDVQPHNVIIFAKDRDISMYEIDFNLNTFNFLATQVDVLGTFGEFKRMLIDDYQFLVASEVNRIAIAAGDYGNGIKFCTRQLDSREALQYFDPEARFGINYMPASSYGTTSISLVDAFSDTGGHSVIAQIDTDTGEHVFQQLLVTPVFHFGWYTYAPEFPDNFGSKLKFRQGISREYTYIANSGNLYRLNLDTGIVLKIGSLDDYSAPAITGPQYYDAAKGFILYHADGTLVKLYPSRYAGADATVADVIYRTLVESGIDPAYIDVSAVTGITMDGYIIGDNDITGNTVLQDLMDFFHLSGADSGGKLTFRPLSVVTNITLDEREARGAQHVRVALDVVNVGSVEVSYYDTERNGTAFTQVVTRDFMEEYDDFVSNVESVNYTAAVFTNSTVARVSAERTLMALLQRQDTLELYTAPRNLLLEPGDMVNGYRIKSMEIDVTLETNILAKSERSDIYEYTPLLDGVSPPIEDNSQTDYDAGVQNYLLAFALPPLEDDPTVETIYVGLSNPDVGEFVPTPIYTHGPRLVFNLAGTPVTEALIGRLVSYPSYTNRVFTTNYDDSFVVEFNNTIPGGALSNATVLELYNSYTRNVMFIGREVVQYTSVEIDIDGKTATFTGLMRGRFGTDEYMGTHAVNEVCTPYDTESLMSGLVGWDAGDYNLAIAATYDSRAPHIRREVEVPFVDQLPRKWSLAGLKMRKEQTGSDRGLLFRVAPRMAFKNTFTNDGDWEALNTAKVSLAILSAPYDADTFAAEYSKTDYPVDDNLDGVGNTYILHLLTGISLPTDMSSGYLFPESYLFNAGLDYTTDIHTASYIRGNSGFLSAVMPRTFYGGFPYLKSEVGHG